MMTNHEKWVYERNIDEIIDRLRELAGELNADECQKN